MKANTVAPMAQDVPAVPEALKPYEQFVLWRLIQKPGEPKPRKVPFTVTSAHASSTDPATWCTWVEACVAYATGGFNGIGFVFTEADPFVFVDLDDCRDPATGAYNAQAATIHAALPGAWEVSQSGKGLHGVGVANGTALSGKRRKFVADGQRVEVYPAKRFMAIGGDGWTAWTGDDWTATLAAWVPNAETEADHPAVDWIDQPRDGYDGPADDDDLIRRATASRGPLARFGIKATFAEMWDADPAALGQHWPDDGGQDRMFDHSSADLALCNALAWWTGCNPARMLRLFKRSALWRDDERKARLAIVKAVADPDRPFFSRAQRLRDDERIGDDLAADAFPEVLTLEQATADLVFVGAGSLVVSRRSKRMRSKADAVNEWAASKHSIDTGKLDKWGAPVIKEVPVIGAWLASRDRRSADVLAWVPGDGEFCRSPERQQAGDRAFNLWTPPTTLQPPADWHNRVQPFVQHLAYLVPIESERLRFTQWLAHIVRRPGELPHTAYLMFTPKTGTGRGTLASILTRVLRGYVAANVSTDTLFGAYNGRLSMKLLATVDEVREGNSRERWTKAEQLKSKVTEEYRHLNPKYGAQSVEKNCCRWLMFSNHADALPFDNSDRRIIVIENPSACAPAEWYARLHDDMEDPAFIASVQHYLATLNLSGFNPHEHAPMSAAKAKALASLVTDAEDAVRQFKDEWPGDLAFVSDLHRFVGDDTKSEDWCRHEATRAGMRTGERFKVSGRWERPLIVRGQLSPDDIAGAAKRPQVKEAVADARGRFSFGG
ncbi:Primase-polymerase (Primpol) domain-containing protein [Novosphingobium sp. CF614]|uniref:phage NrS-1 polymerase family protein n=1 Tax=Novosphingobium sp. CF614 TaxID=1884364 RepID=UPI0008EAD422|nr:DUF5906 domain-containing protein [Novosphingobium sp. CF614]SFF97005.1 Primase-polymerase (Primpol) domain-containing protein [Novosphingobium sp. CF614]